MNFPGMRTPKPARLLLCILTGCGGADSVDVSNGPVARLEFESPSQGGFVDNVFVPPSVRALDDEGRPVRGTAIDFSLEQGGELTTAVAWTAGDGRAAPAGWRLGPIPGAQRMVARVGNVSAVATVQVVTTPVSSFAITLRFVNEAGVGSRDRAAIEGAAIRWTELVIGDLPDAVVPATLASGCPSGVVAAGTPIDDLMILVSVTTLPGGAGTTTICARRPGPGLPSVALVRVDPFKATGLGGLQAVMRHEIAHALGFGTIWSGDLVDRNGDLRFKGANANAAWRLSVGAEDAVAGVPVESGGAPGVARVHWKESALSQELMTSYANAGFEPLSAISVAALRDLGYVVDDARADPFPGDWDYSVGGLVTGGVSREDPGPETPMRKSSTKRQKARRSLQGRKPGLKASPRLRKKQRPGAEPRLRAGLG